MSKYRIALILWLAFAAIGSPSPAFADDLAADKNFCNLELAPFIFDMSETEKAQVTKIETAYKKLRLARTPKRRLQLQLPEYVEDLLQMEALLENLVSEIQPAVDELRHAYQNGRQDSFYRGYLPGTPTFSYNHPAFVDFDIIGVTNMVRAKIRKFAANGPTYEQLLFVSRFTTNLIGDIAHMREKIANAKPLTHENVRDYLARTPGSQPNSILFFLNSQWRFYIGDEIADAMFSKNQGRLNEPVLDFFDNTIESIAEAILAKNDKVLPIIVLDNELLPPTVMSELTWLNLQVLQVLPNLRKYKVHGTFATADYSWLHDTSHLGSTAPGLERSAYALLNRMKAAVDKDHPEWIPLLKLLVFFHRHEDERKIEALPRELNRYLFDFRNPDPQMPPFRERVRDDLKDPQMKILFNSSWEDFIRYMIQRFGG